MSTLALWFPYHPRSWHSSPFGSNGCVLDQLDSPFSFATNSANFTPSGLGGSVRWSRCVEGRIIHARPCTVHDYWTAQKVQDSTAHCSLELKSHRRNRITASLWKKEGVPVTAHMEGMLRKETTSWQLWALGNSCQTYALWLVFLSQNRSMQKVFYDCKDKAGLWKRILPGTQSASDFDLEEKTISLTKKQTLTLHLPCARHCSENITNIYSCNPHNQPSGLRRLSWLQPKAEGWEELRCVKIMCFSSWFEDRRANTLKSVDLCHWGRELINSQIQGEKVNCLLCPGGRNWEEDCSCKDSSLFDAFQKWWWICNKPFT